MEEAALAAEEEEVLEARHSVHPTPPVDSVMSQPSETLELPAIRLPQEDSKRSWPLSKLFSILNVDVGISYSLAKSDSSFIFFRFHNTVPTLLETI